MFEWMTDPAGWAALATLTAMEVILGIDNVIFISVLVSRLPKEQADKARTIGLALAFLFRVGLLFTLTWMIGLVEPVFSILGKGFSWRDIILFVGGAFLVAKATHEIHQSMEEDELSEIEAAAPKFFFAAILQIAVVDLVFSIDSINTAIGMADQLGVMIAAVVIAMVVMYVSSGPVSAFIAEHPTTKMLALAFLILIGASLCAEASGFHLPRGYIYAAMAFAAAVETINIMAASKKKKRKKIGHH
ncbi:MAG: TerC family protein [Beijerinckiaceae bacterium]|nr:TerC family protein [Beijerinckiaceae bacterium]